MAEKVGARGDGTQHLGLRQPQPNVSYLAIVQHGIAEDPLRQFSSREWGKYIEFDMYERRGAKNFKGTFQGVPFEIFTPPCRREPL